GAWIRHGGGWMKAVELTLGTRSGLGLMRDGRALKRFRDQRPDSRRKLRQPGGDCSREAVARVKALAADGQQKAARTTAVKFRRPIQERSRRKVMRERDRTT